MYDISDIKVIHLELTSKCQARCPQCGRFDAEPSSETFMKIHPRITDRNGKSGCLDEISFLDFFNWFPPKFISQLNYLYMCGTSGEPTLGKDCLKIFAYLRKFNSKMNLSLHTNGGCKSKEWWQKLAKLNVKVVFGIDGMEDTHSLYRVNTNWRTIIKNARAFIEAGGKAEWQMLVFKHNEHQIKECMTLAKLLGFESFCSKHTTRFAENLIDMQPVYNPKGEITHYLEPSSVTREYYQQMESSYSDIDHEKEVIDCSAKKESSIYISANGNILPCCHMESCIIYDNEDILDYKNKINVSYNLYKKSLREIFDTMYFKNIENTWNKDVLKVCSKTCGKITGTFADTNSKLTFWKNFSQP